jgi:DNA polymerase III delta subunit
MQLSSVQEFNAYVKKELPSVLLILGKETNRFSVEQALDHFFSELKGCAITKNPTKLDDELFSPSFFKEKKVLFLDGVDGLKDKEQQLLVRFLKRPDPYITLVLTAEALKTTSELYKALEAYLIVQFPKETPWDKEAKITHWIEQFFKKRHVAIHSKLADTLAKTVKGDFHALMCELEKLYAYIGEAKEVTEKDVAAISTLWQENSLWQLTDALLQGTASTTLSLLKNIDQQDVYSLVVVRHLRNTLCQLLEIATRIEAREPNISEHYPKLKGKLFEKAHTNASKIGIHRLRLALSLVDGVEGDLKESAADETTLLQTLLLKLRHALFTS